MNKFELVTTFKPTGDQPQAIKSIVDTFKMCIKRQHLGRMTLNPIPHIDLIGTILFPLIGSFTGIPMIGWAKPVPINSNQFKNWRSGVRWTALAGPFSNILLGVISAFAFGAFLRFVPSTFDLFEPIVKMLQMSIYINFALAIFNLIPLPPLDGSRVIESYLNYNQALKFDAISKYSFIILMVLLYLKVINIIVGVPMNILANLTLTIVSKIFGIA